MNIALFLSSDGIAMAHRQAAGHWAMIGETPFDVPDLGVPLSAMHAQAVEREGKRFKALVVLPDDQILYTSLTVPTGDPELTAFRIEDGLEGLTPYAVTELEYAWEELEQDRVKIAVVASETLEEARSFAKQYGFTVKGFAAVPPMEKFPGVPTFALGDDAGAMGFTADGMAFGADNFGQPVEEAPAAKDADAPAPEGAAAEPEPEQPDTPKGPADTDAASAGDAGDPADATPEAAPDAAQTKATASKPAPEAQQTLDFLAPEPEPEPQPEPEVLPEPDTAAVDQAPQEAATDAAPLPETPPKVDAPEAPKQAAAADASLTTPAEAPAKAPPAPASALRDPTSDPVQNISQATAPDADPQVSQEVVGDAGGDDDLLPPAPSAAVLMARERARIVRGQNTKPAASPPEGGTTPPAGKLERPAFAGPVPSGDPTSDLSASRGPVANPEGERGSLVGKRSSRFGLTAPTGAASAPDTGRAPLVPDAKPVDAAERATPAPAPEKASGAAGMPRLAEQLQRVRSASTSKPVVAASIQPPRPRVEIDTEQPLDRTIAAPRPSPFEGMPEAAKPAGDGLLGRLAGLRQKSARKPAPEPDIAADDVVAEPSVLPEDDTADGPDQSGPTRRFGLRRGKAIAVAETSQTPGVAEDETFASGLLARKAATPTGGSLKTGLILTAILLLLLVLVAIWSAIFLPNSAVARLFGLGTQQVAVAPEDMDGLDPDVALIAPDDLAGGDPSLSDEAAADGIDVSVAIPDETTADPDATTEVAAVAPEDLPDIDAELDLPPLPPIDQGLNPSLEEAEALYAEDGIWARSPERPDLRPFDLVDRTYTAAIDPDVTIFDAVALPDAGVDLAESFAPIPPPPPFGAEFNLTAEGLVSPTPEGVVTPEGAFVVLGIPSTLPQQRPREVISEPPAPEVGADGEVEIEDALLGTLRPAERPSDLAETRERQVLNGLTEAELADVRPVSRPASPQETAAQASLVPVETPTDPEAVEAAVREAIAGTELAIARSLLPRTRPANISQIVASADRSPPEEATTVVSTAVAAAPSIPSNADVSRAATERNAIRLRNVNLIGVSGTSSDRRALVRLPSGRIVRVDVGDRLDGGRVAAIGATTLQYVRSGRTVTLEIPG